MNVKMKDDQKYWYGLVILGLLSLLNAFYSMIMKPNDIIHHFQVINVHWITTVILFAGVAPFIFPQKTLKSETAIVVTNVISLCICFSCGVADIGNVIKKMFPSANTTVPWFMDTDEINTRNYLFMYNCFDLMICTAAACFSYKLIENRINVSPRVHMVDSRRLQGYGLALIILSSLGIMNHVYQRYLMMQKNKAIFLDMHTIDEFSWLMINLATGIIILVSSRANQLLQTVGFVLCGATIYPSFFYAWLDYRIMTTAHVDILYKQAIFSLAISIPHMVVLLTVFLTFVMSRRDATSVSLKYIHKVIFIGFSFFFMMVCMALVNINLYSMATKQFFQIFHSSENKLPFLTAFLSVFTGLSVMTKFNFITISISIVIGIISINATYLHIFSYLYLRYHGNFIDGTDLEFLVLPADKYDNGTTNSTVHHVETSVNFLSLIGSFALVVFLFYISKTHVRQSESDEDTVTETHKTNQTRVLKLGVCLLVAALFILAISSLFFVLVDTSHPLITIYSQLFQLVLAFSITSFALFQVLVAEKLAKHPLFTCSLMILCIIRTLDILTQLDYKDMQSQPITWSIHAFIEYIAMFLNFLTISVVFHIDGAGRPLIEPADIPLSFENPLGNETDENGYIMLRTADSNEMPDI